MGVQIAQIQGGFFDFETFKSTLYKYTTSMNLVTCETLNLGFRGGVANGGVPGKWNELSAQD